MRVAVPSIALLALTLAACSGEADASPSPPRRAPSPPPRAAAHHGTERAPAPPAGRAEAIFAGGCFWCMEAPFESVEGVDAVLSGYTGGHVDSPAYEEVSRGGTGHLESVRVVYDPSRVSYAALLDVYVHNIDPTQANGQFCDHGNQYRSAIFVHDAAERRLAEQALEQAHARLGRTIVTEIHPVGPFWVAEGYHQDFYRTHPARYTSYRNGCGRDARLRELWGADSGGH
jgi:peptide-methionine (S)-S-oxide reductase